MADSAGLGASGWVCIVMEDVMGTYLGPDDPGAVWVPIIDETLEYTEEPYYSSQIRGEVVDIERTQGFYHVEGDLNMEFDAQYAPYFMYCSRHNITSAAGTPNTYTFTPSNTAGAFNTGGDNPKTMSITVVRNGEGFGYAGCVVPRMEFTIDTGVLRMNLGIFGLSEQEPLALDTPVWAAPELHGAASHAVYRAAAGTAPTFTTPDDTFNGFTATFEHNATAENRLNGQRSATYIAYHKTEPTFETELDFLDRTEYDKFVASEKMAIRFESIIGGTDFTDADAGVQIDFNNAVYDSYPVHLTALEDLVMAQTTGRGLAIAGGSPYRIRIKSDVALAAVQS